MRQAEQGQQRNIPLAQFDLADIRVSYASSPSECFLGETPLQPVLAECRSEKLEWCRMSGWWARCRVAVVLPPHTSLCKGLTAME